MKNAKVNKSNFIKNIKIVSLSRGTVGEDFVSHELKLGIERLKELNLNFSFSKNALKGIKYLENSPGKRAQDLLEAFKDKDTDLILCAIGGDDTYRLTPYLFKNNELEKVITNKIFLGFSDTTFNHFMLNKLGLVTYYGQSFLADICEMSKDMLSYTKKYFLELIKTGKIKKIKPSKYWYESRTSWDKKYLGTTTKKHLNQGFISLQGNKIFKGKIFGGCFDSIYDMFDNTRYKDTTKIVNDYNLFPSLDYWKNKILLLETSEEKPNPTKFKKGLMFLKKKGLFNVINGILLGKPMDETYFEEYKKILIEVVNNKNLPIVVNINIGHAMPRCIIPFNVDSTVNVNKQEITFNYQNDFIAKCGLDCSKCEAYKATINNDDNLRIIVAKKWSKLNNITIKPKEINCLGCNRLGIKSNFCKSLCPIRQCALKNKFFNCGTCKKLNKCNKIKMIISTNKKVLKNLKK